ncbi:MAG: FecR family protein [Muribaculaceae bacterium]|nr:FecR family protein [Muribaculaceae bacterium]
MPKVHDSAISDTGAPVPCVPMSDGIDIAQSDKLTDYDKILRYLTMTPELPDDIKARIESWVLDHSNDKELSESMASIWSSLNPEPYTSEPLGLARLLNSVTTTDTSAQRHRPLWIWQAATAAAVAVIIILCGCLIFHSSHTPSDTMLITASGSVGEFTLPDGSHVWLNGATTLTYNQDFGTDGYRRVHIDGEAYFDVKREPQHPFIVDMNMMEVEVLGTSFEVRNYAGCRTCDVVLRKGSVKVRGPWGNDEVTMHTDQILTLNRKDNHMCLNRTEADNYCRWFESYSTFDNEPLSDILLNISRRYGMDLTIDNDVDTSLRMSVTIGSETIDNVMAVLTYLTPVAYHIHDNCLYIHNVSE